MIIKTLYLNKENATNYQKHFVVYGFRPSPNPIFYKDRTIAEYVTEYWARDVGHAVLLLFGRIIFNDNLLAYIKSPTLP